MHRSGTSATTRILNLLGLDLGPNLIAPQTGVNDKGFWEHADIVRLHNELLSELRSSWHAERPLPQWWWNEPHAQVYRRKIDEVLDRDFGNSPLCGIKDPRLSRLLPLWLDILHDRGNRPTFVICLRHPEEVVHSLKKRDGISASESLLLWMNYTLAAEMDTHGYPRVFVCFNDLIADWRESFRRILSISPVTFPNSIEDVADDVRGFLRSDLRHHIASTEFSEADVLSNMALELYRMLRVADDGKVSDLESLERIRIQVSKLTTNVAPWVQRIQSLDNLLVHAKDEILSLQQQQIELELLRVDLEQEITHVKSTVSWQITKPLRFFAHILKFGSKN